MKRGIALGIIFTTLNTPIISQEERVSYSRDVAPILASRCAGCHGPDAWWDEPFQRKFDVTSYEALLKGGESGPAIIPKQSSKSLLVQYLLKGEMPFAGSKLADSTIDTLRRWIDQGAQRDARPWPAVTIRLDDVQLTRDENGNIEENILCRIPKAGYVTATVYDRSGRVLYRRGGGVVPEGASSFGSGAVAGGWVHWPLSWLRSSHGRVPKFETNDVSIELTIEHVDPEQLSGAEFDIERDNLSGNAARLASTFVRNPVSISTDSGGRFSYQLDADADVDIEIAALDSQRAVPIFRDRQRDLRAGTKSYTWTLKDSTGRLVTPGTYVARFRCRSRNSGKPVNDICILVTVTA